MINTTDAEAYKILVAQRKKRPIAPHLSIYQPQLTWYSSAANRITGVALSGAIYAYFAAYAAAPLVGWQGLDTASIAEVFGSFPEPVKIGIKSAIALPFTYHSWNSLRHLVWDTTTALDIKDVYRTGYACLAVMAVTTVWLAML
ncbi:cytochrome b560 subunit of succinate dehydrogenase [Wilcoxina mikolae CBS 423.85]|nr:cytochrome b560 subunit of succinate dehydrogenase [Wilcoxina mikolae CBS 423.85]